MLETLGPPAAALCAFAALFVWASWRAAQPADPLKPRLAPWRSISVVAGVAALLSFLLLVARLRPPS